MATIKINTNIGEVSARLQKRIEKLKDKDYLIRPLCFDLIDLMTKRIHYDGKAADETDIGTYNTEYLKLRQKKYQRDSNQKVIVSLTRELENDWSVIATAKGYGIGFKNVFNYQKAAWVEDAKRKVIFKLTKTENKYAIDFINEMTRRALTDD